MTTTTTTTKSQRVTLDPHELDDLAELMRLCYHRHQAIRTNLDASTAALQLETRSAPTRRQAVALQSKVRQVADLLSEISRESLKDMESLKRTAALARDAESPGTPWSPDKAKAYVQAAAGTPEQKAALYASLVGGIGTAKGAYTAPHVGREPTKASALVDLARKQLGSTPKADFVAGVLKGSGHDLKTPLTVEGLRKEHLLHTAPRVGSIYLGTGDETGIVTSVHKDGSFTTLEAPTGSPVVERTHPAADAKSAAGFGWVV